MTNFSEPNYIKHELSELEQKYLYNLGVKNFKTKNYSRALAIFQMLFIWDGSDSMYCKALAGCYQASGNCFMAALMYSHCLNIDDSLINKDCLFYLGVCLFELKDYQAAKNHFSNFKTETAQIMPELHKKTDLYLKALQNLIKDNLISEAISGSN